MQILTLPIINNPYTLLIVSSLHDSEGYNILYTFVHLGLALQASSLGAGE